MILKDILAISGQPGLFKFIAQGKNAVIVEHLETKKRSGAFSSAKVSSLDEISVFTEKEDMPLGKVFDLIHEKENGGPSIDSKTDPDKLKNYFSEVLPEYSKDRVYTSDIKKVVQWYNILQKLNLLVKEEPEKPAEPETKGESGKKKEAEAKKISASKKKEAASQKGGPASKMKTSKLKEK
ncbi:MAG: DUF5606 domain-containing protein [Bacteroidales bacterium]|nr:DUF5606 domain-containing protein [Bacteroidales bacterium]